MDKVGAVTDFPAKEMTEAKVKGTTVLVVNDGENLYVTASRCPHMHGELAHGSLDGTIITCPLHGSQFDAKTGDVIRWTRYTGMRLKAIEAIRPPRNLKTYETAIKEGFLYIEGLDG